MTKKVTAGLAVSARSGKEPADCSFLLLGTQTVRKIHTLQGDVLTSVTLMIDCLKEILQFATCWLLFYKMQCVGGWTEEYL